MPSFSSLWLGEIKVFDQFWSWVPRPLRRPVKTSSYLQLKPPWDHPKKRWDSHFLGDILFFSNNFFLFSPKLKLLHSSFFQPVAHDAFLILWLPKVYGVFLSSRRERMSFSPGSREFGGIKISHHDNSTSRREWWGLGFFSWSFSSQSTSTQVHAQWL